jgi:hypothetical protein
MIFAALNRGISIINKRLRLLDSDLIRNDLLVALYAQVTEAADTIAFVQGTEGVADTITDSASGFVTAGFAAGMDFTSDQTANLGPFKIASLSAGTITLATTGGVTAVAAGSTVTLTSISDYGYLPADFWGLLDQEKPYLNGRTWPLWPIPNQDTRLQYTSPGDPYYYEIMGQKIYTYPATAANETIKGRYWQKQAKITSAEQILPYNELFDDSIVEFLVGVLEKGTAMIASADAYFNKAVDMWAVRRGKIAPKRLDRGIAWNDLF